MQQLGDFLPLSIEMQAIWLILLSPFVGSFLGLVVIRLPLGEPVLRGRSKCRSCGEKLAVIDLLPILSFILFRGRCRRCNNAMSPIYLTCEIGAFVIAFWSAMIIDPAFWLPSCLLGWSLLCLSLIDLRTFRLPNQLTGFVLVSGALTVALLLRETYLTHFAGAVLGFALLFIVRVTYARLRNAEGLGQGDEKLFAAGGLWLGVGGIGSALLIAAFSALLFVFARRLLGAPMDLRTRVPFGPFLSGGIWLTWVYGPLIF